MLALFDGQYPFVADQFPDPGLTETLALEANSAVPSFLFSPSTDALFDGRFFLVADEFPDPSVPETFAPDVSARICEIPDEETSR